MYFSCLKKQVIFTSIYRINVHFPPLSRISSSYSFKYFLLPSWKSYLAFSPFFLLHCSILNFVIFALFETLFHAYNFLSYFATCGSGRYYKSVFVDIEFPGLILLTKDCLARIWVSEKCSPKCLKLRKCPQGRYKIFIPAAYSKRQY
jgi:hypothetical protein